MRLEARRDDGEDHRLVVIRVRERVQGDDQDPKMVYGLILEVT